MLEPFTRQILTQQRLGLQYFIFLPQLFGSTPDGRLLLVLRVLHQMIFARVVLGLPIAQSCRANPIAESVSGVLAASSALTFSADGVAQFPDHLLSGIWRIMPPV